MTIKYSNKKGMKFNIDVRLKEDDSILVQIRLFSTRSQALTRRDIHIPYAYGRIIAPFDFNSLEEGIKNIIDSMYRDSGINEFRQEDLVEAVDILMIQQAPVEDIDLVIGYDVYTHSSV
ncbi:c1 protein [Sida leaf curl virus-associated DNA beta]|uniref:C1 protein n=1 Tax=Sida leaf curl virus-associated DNA beta TaxID=337824 RepID=Q2WCL1_9VIRU|nr:c1 protein [Sida leaf curl virus-associated DNA beta]UPX95535.1 betaC1 protein [Sida leaf curl virus-associated DNA beta]CAJ19258.1 c1 protein [Sida leaf curl virus-associated DNA beta]